MKLIAIEPAIQRYEWGSAIAVPALFGWSSDGQPIAELWFGDHPRGPSTGFDARGPQPLDRLLDSDPELGGRLRFLLKVLSAAAPLSLQCHPDPARAERGFAREQAAGIPLGARERSFSDPLGKSELVVALSRFEALAGVRPAAEIRAGFARVGLGGGLGDLLPGDDAAVPRFVAALLQLAGPRREETLAAARVGAARETDASDAWLGRLLTRHPSDTAALAPLFMNHVALEPGEALFLESGRLHAYLGGMALELTGASDNVARAGMTAKHVDLAVVLDVADLSPSAPVKVAPTAAAGYQRYSPDGAGLTLELCDVTASAVARTVGSSAVMAVCLRGDVSFVAGGETLELGTGDACMIAAAVPFEMSGRGRAVLASAT